MAGVGRDGRGARDASARPGSSADLRMDDRRARSAGCAGVVGTARCRERTLNQYAGVGQADFSNVVDDVKRKTGATRGVKSALRKLKTLGLVRVVAKNRLELFTDVRETSCAVGEGYAKFIARIGTPARKKFACVPRRMLRELTAPGHRIAFHVLAVYTALRCITRKRHKQNGNYYTVSGGSVNIDDLVRVFNVAGQTNPGERVSGVPCDAEDATRTRVDITRRNFAPVVSHAPRRRPPPDGRKDGDSPHLWSSSGTARRTKLHRNGTT